MSEQELLAHISTHRLILISASELWPGDGVAQDAMLHKAMRRHRKALAVRIRQSWIETCPNRDLHRRYWRYAGQGRYVCDACQRLDSWMRAG